MRVLYFLLPILFCYGLAASGKAEIDSLHQRAYSLLDTNPDSAFVLGGLAEVQAASRGLDFEEATSLFIQAYVYRQQNELGKAFVLYLKALELLRPLPSEKAKFTYAKILLNTGEILKQHYAYPQAVQYYDEGIRVALNHSFNERLIKLYYGKAMSLRHDKKYEEALATISSTLELSTTESSEEWIMSSLNQQGLILKDMGRYEEARESYQQIIDFNFKQIQPERYRGQAWHNMAVTFVEEKRYMEAVEAYSKALKEKTVGDEKRLYITYLDLGEVYYLIGDYKAAYETEQKALSLYDDMLLLPDHYAIFRLLSRITYTLGEYDQSHAYSEQFMAVNRRFLQAQKEILQVKDQYKMEILTAGFFLEMEAAETERQFHTVVMILGSCAALFIFLFGYEKVKQYNVRRSIKKAILDIEQEGGSV